MLVPVVLPPGCASEFTSPDPTISSVDPRIGIVAVARPIGLGGKRSDFECASTRK